MTTQSTTQAATLPPCPVCGMSDWSEIGASARLRSCTGCGMVLNDRSSNRMEEEERYRARRHGPLAGEDAVAEAEWMLLRSALNLPTASENLTLLDVGCGHGAFLQTAEKHGLNATGIELDPGAVESCRRRGLNVVEGSVFDTGALDGNWNIVTLWDVLEQLDEPAAVLDLIAKSLSPGGAIVIRGRNAKVHLMVRRNFTSFGTLARLFKLKDPSVVHRWGISPRGYTRLLQQAMFTDVRIHTGLPTPGDRYRTLGPKLLASAVKTAVSSGATLLYRVSFGRVYLFPSVLISAKIP